MRVAVAREQAQLSSQAVVHTAMTQLLTADSTVSSLVNGGSPASRSDVLDQVIGEFVDDVVVGLEEREDGNPDSAGVEENEAEGFK